MNRQFGKSIATIITALLVSFAIFSQTVEPRYEELPNFHQVNEHLYRGGQPKESGLKKLAEMGIKTIVNLRSESGETDAEESLAKDLGFRYFSVPMSGVGRPKEEQIRRIIEIIDTSENAPVFIHCRRGADRTGVVIAIYRITHDGWTAEQAIDEANRYDMGFVQFQKRNYIKDYFKNHQNAGRR